MMNERIKELAEQAGYLPDNFGIGHWDMPECKKFAELIVQKCANLADEAEPYKAADLIKKHFGVEEPVQVSNLHYCPYAAEINGDYETLCDCDEERTYQCAMDT
jgi:hypothetical protein